MRQSRVGSESRAAVGTRETVRAIKKMLKLWKRPVARPLTLSRPVSQTIVPERTSDCIGFNAVNDFIVSFRTRSGIGESSETITNALCRSLEVSFARELRILE